MPDRLTPLDASFLFLEDGTTPMHAGEVAIFTPPPGGFDHERLVRLIKQRLPFVPRYRKRVRTVPFGFARPVWVDDERFDVTFHVRRSAVPKPGTRDQLNELVARLMSRPLDRTRPLWEMYLIEGLEDGCFAIVSKSHQALIDGLSAVDIAQVILDESEQQVAVAADSWRPRHEPSDIELLTTAVTELAVRPSSAVDAVLSTVGDVTTAIQGAAARTTSIVSTALAAARPTASTPLNVAIGEQRRFATVDFDLADLKEVRNVLGGRINDVVLAIITGALRSWLMARGGSVEQGDELKALLPVSIEVPRSAGEAGGSRVSAQLIGLPVGEPDPALRLQQLGYHMGQLEEGAHFVGAESIVSIAGFAPPTLHALGARVGSSLSRKVYNLVITNVPGPQHPLYAAGSRMVATYACVPLTKGQALSIGVTSYDGGVFIGLYGDRDAMYDLDVLVTCIEESMSELRARAEQSRRPLRAVRGGRRVAKGGSHAS